VLGGGRADDDLVHVDVGRVEQTAFFRSREDGDGVCGAGGAEVRSFERIDRDVDLGIDLAFSPAAAEGLADIEHRSLVALSLADDDRPAHLEPVQLFAHRLHRYLVGVFAFAIAHRARRGDGCFFRNA